MSSRRGADTGPPDSAGPFRILHLEDSARDAELLSHRLAAGGVNAAVVLVTDREGFEAALARETFDLVLTDYNVPGYDGIAAVRLARERAPLTPVIVVSGTVGEEEAVRCLHVGATDYLMKTRLERLVPAVRRALEEAQEHRRRVAAEEALRLRGAVLEAAADAVVITDRHGTIEWVNPAFTTLTGYAGGEVVGGTPRLLKSGKHDPAFYQHLWDTILAGGVWRGEMTNRRKDGTLYSEMQTITPVRNASGQITHFVGIKRDLTEEKRLQSQFLQAQKMESVGRLAAGIAHDFNNVLTVIMGAADLAAQAASLDHPVQRDLAEIRRSGARAATLTRQLLAFSRRQMLQSQVVDLTLLVTDLRSMLARVVGEDVTLDFVGAADPVTVKVDPGQIEQVLVNLVVNARDAMPDGGTITVEARNVDLDAAWAGAHPAGSAGPHALLAVRDTGMGMDEATRQLALEPFFTTKPPGKGTGLGLATVYGIVKQSGGSVWISSEVGKGTSVEIYLPRTAEQVPARTRDAAPAKVAVRGSETILLVEDDDALRRVSSRALTLAGYTVLLAAGGSEARQLIDRADRAIDLVVTDVVMPGMSGPELVRGLRASGVEIKMLYTSGYAKEFIARGGAVDDGVPFLQKPYSIEELTRKVRQVLDA